MASNKSIWLAEPINDKVALACFSSVLGTLVMYCIGIPIYFSNLRLLQIN
ncbi:hypothetical protein GGQ84_003057 [Desulfitispora alkaliphila]